MAERVRRGAAAAFLVATVIAAVLVPLKGITPVPGLILLTLFLVSVAAKPEPGSQDPDVDRAWTSANRDAAS